jgi:NAD(P)-dependent dehydrogenase (short-subunit alcohol dehydrogenase family)
MAQPLAIVAGVGPQLGLALVRRFAADGYRVAMIARRTEALERYVSQVGNGAFGHAGDLADPGDTARVMAEIESAHGPAALLIYNASRWNPTRAMALAPEEFTHDLALSVAGALVTSQAVHRSMKEAGGGTILFTGNAIAHHPERGTGSPSLTVGKAALRSLALAMAKPLRNDGIRVGLISIDGTIRAGGPLDPDRIAARFAAWAALPPGDETVEVIIDGKSG